MSSWPLCQRHSRSFRQCPCWLTISIRRGRRASECSCASIANCSRTFDSMRSRVATSASCGGASKCTRMKKRPVAPGPIRSPNCCESMMLQPAWNNRPETAWTMPLVSRQDRRSTNSRSRDRAVCMQRIVRKRSHGLREAEPRARWLPSSSGPRRHAPSSGVRPLAARSPALKTSMSVAARFIARLAGACSLALVGACASLPTIAPADAATASESGVRIRIDGPHGPLSDAAQKRVLDRLKATGQDTDIFERHLAFEQEIVGAPLVAGNKVTLLQDGPSTYRALYAAMAGASNSAINMESYIFEDDEVGQRFAHELRRGAGARGRRQPDLRQRRLAEDAAKAYFEGPGRARRQRPRIQPGRSTQGAHRRLGGQPARPPQAHRSSTARKCLRRRDQHQQRVLEAARSARDRRTGPASRCRGADHRPRASKGPGRRRVPENVHGHLGPAEGQADGRRPTTSRQLAAPGRRRRARDRRHADRAEQPDLRDARLGDPQRVDLHPARQRLLRSRPATARRARGRRAARRRRAAAAPQRERFVARDDERRPGATTEELLDAGAKIYERHNALLHSKTTLIDGVWCAVGSTNLDWRSFLHNDEIDAIVLSAPTSATRLRAAFLQDLAQSRRWSAARWWSKRPHEDWERRPLLQRVLPGR